MKKTDAFTKALAVVLFAAAAIYLGAWLLRSTRESVVTAPVTRSSVSDSAQADGIAVREEQLLSADKQFVSVQAEDGREVSAGQTLATAMDSEASLQRMNHIAELKLEISSLETMLSGVTASSSDVTSRDADIRSAVLELSSSVARGEVSGVEGAALNLSALVFKTDAAADSEAKLTALKKELAGYSQSSIVGSDVLTAPDSGMFSESVDGYENVTPKMLENLTVSGLNKIMSAQTDVDVKVYGKLVTSYRWYFAAELDKSYAARLSVGKTVYLDFQRYTSEKIPAKVMGISAAEDGKCAVVFYTERALSDTLAMRKASAEIVFSEEDGLRVPLKSVHVDKDGTYVYCITAQQVEKKYVDIVSTEDDYYLVAIGEDANALREGNTVVVSGKDIHEGKVIEP